MGGWRKKPRRSAALTAALVTAAILALACSVAAASPSLQERLDRTRERIADSDRREGVLSSTIKRHRARASTLRADVARLSARDVALAERLAEIEARLEEARERRRRAEAELLRVRERLAAATRELRSFLVAIYRSGEPDVLTVILESDGFDELLSRSEYASRLAEYREEVIGRVRALQARVRRALQRRREAEAVIEGARIEVAERRERLAAVRRRLATRRRALQTTVARERRALSAVNQQRSRLEKVAVRLQSRIEAQLAASATPPSPAGPAIPGDAQGTLGSSGLIWPVEGPITSPFGPRWGRLHAGIDIAAPGGTPIRAAAAGSVEIAAPSGGYGNYTCVNHAGGLATCYAHQSAFATSAGATVKQGQVIGYVGNTGNSFGDHLHFEVRANGTPQDPLGYL